MAEHVTQSTYLWCGYPHDGGCGPGVCPPHVKLRKGRKLPCGCISHAPVDHQCGDSWCDGELYPRPFARGWRRRAVKQHRKLWDRASHGKPPTYAELFPEDFEEAS